MTQRPEPRPDPPTPPQAPVIVDARRVLAGQREVLLHLDGTIYRLRLTRRNKLILQK